MDGNDGDDSINGGTGNDTIQGMGNNDTLNGAAGNDEMEGGSGADVFQASQGNDTIKDFELGSDELFIDKLIFSEYSTKSIVQGSEIIGTEVLLVEATGDKSHKTTVLFSGELPEHEQNYQIPNSIQSLELLQFHLKLLTTSKIKLEASLMAHSLIQTLAKIQCLHQSKFRRLKRKSKI